MRANEFLIEGKNHPVIVVDVQPAYDRSNDEGRGKAPLLTKIIDFVNNQTGRVLMFVNANETGTTDNSIDDIRNYWDETACGWDSEDERYIHNNETDEYEEAECDNQIEWHRFEIVDKGYGYLRAWMDSGVEESIIIKVIREMYQQRVNDSRELFGGEDDKNYVKQMDELVGTDAWHDMYSDNLNVEWTSVAQLKEFNGAYIVGGGRDECLREVELLMNAFNIKYKRIDSLVYG